jgi:hypothetical protein
MALYRHSFRAAPVAASTSTLPKVIAGAGAGFLVGGPIGAGVGAATMWLLSKKAATVTVTTARPPPAVTPIHPNGQPVTDANAAADARNAQVDVINAQVAAQNAAVALQNDVTDARNDVQAGHPRQSGRSQTYNDAYDQAMGSLTSAESRVLAAQTKDDALAAASGHNDLYNEIVAGINDANAGHPKALAQSPYYNHGYDLVVTEKQAAAAAAAAQTEVWQQAQLAEIARQAAANEAAAKALQYGPAPVTGQQLAAEVAAAQAAAAATAAAVAAAQQVAAAPAVPAVDYAALESLVRMMNYSNLPSHVHIVAPNTPDAVMFVNSYMQPKYQVQWLTGWPGGYWQTATPRSQFVNAPVWLMAEWAQEDADVAAAN